MDYSLEGKNIILRPARASDRRTIFEWLAHSDLTRQMLGSPDFPDNPAPTWEEFNADYHPYFFDGSAPLLGRCFIIELNKEPIGQINYNEIDVINRAVELDIWLAGSQFANRGYGTDAIITLCNYLHHTFEIKQIYIAPSRRNTAAVKAYTKAGFVETSELPAWFVPDYDDTIVMIKNIIK